MAGAHPTPHTPASRRAAPSVGDLVPGVLARLGLADGIAKWRAVVEWEAIAGEALARHARPSRVDGDTLIIQAENSYVMFELSHRKAELLERLAAHLGDGTIRDVRLVLGRNQEARP
jgi:predicted nucleic acid-binding Zn ribbon protein